MSKSLNNFFNFKFIIRIFIISYINRNIFPKSDRNFSYNTLNKIKNHLAATEYTFRYFYRFIIKKIR